MYVKVSYNKASFIIAMAGNGFLRSSELKKLDSYLSSMDDFYFTIDELLVLNVAVSYNNDSKPLMKTKLEYVDFQAALMRYMKGRACEMIFGHRNYKELTDDELLYFEIETGHRLSVELKQYNMVDL